MSDLSITLEALERARSQLSVSTYFEEDLFRREQELIFQHGPRYLAHELAIPEIGDFYALPQEGEVYVQQGVLDATFQYPTGGAEAIDTALKILHGETVPKEIVLGTRLFDHDNVSQGGEELK